MNMLNLNITAAERVSGRLAPHRRESALAALREHGYVVLAGAVQRSHALVLRRKMLADLPRIVERCDAPFNFNTGNIQQEPPPFSPYLFRDVLLNDYAIELTHALLGAGVKNSYYSGNTAMPFAGSRQPVHVDLGQLWPGLEQATPPYAYVVNVPIVDMTPENGSTELWPGSHLDTTMHVQMGDLKVPEAALEARRQVAPPLQPTVPAGSILIRDIRLWHAGMPNLTPRPRPMIAMIHGIAWWNTDQTIDFPRGTEEFFQHPLLETSARFVAGAIDYIHHSEAYEFETPQRSRYRVLNGSS
jgi:hypothetical protein